MKQITEFYQKKLRSSTRDSNVQITPEHRTPCWSLLSWRSAHLTGPS